jgi:hypothetical protein
MTPKEFKKESGQLLRETKEEKFANPFILELEECDQCMSINGSYNKKS